MDVADLALSLVIALYIYWEFWSLIWLVLAITGCWFMKRYRQRSTGTKIPGSGRGVLITGCDTGIGHATAIRLFERGFTVFAGCLSTSGPGAKQLGAKGPRLHVLSMDVTDDKSVASACTFVTNNCPEKGLFAVINNAGINIMADVELATIEFYKRVADVNIYGMIRVTKAFCPLIRTYKGRFINVTSVKGRMCGPLDSTYTITKWAGEAFSDILRREMIRFGVKVIIIEPGDFGGLTGMLSKDTIQRMEGDLNAAWDLASSNVRQAYGREYVDALLNSVRGAGTTCAASLAPVTDAMEDAVRNPNPSYRYLVDGSSSMMDKFCMFARLHPLLPEGLMDRILPYFYPLPPVKEKVA